MSDKPLASKGSSRLSRVRCGKCPACLQPDCGKCDSCRRKRKFGGDGSSKQACALRQCKNLVPRKEVKSGTYRASNRQPSSYPSRSEVGTRRRAGALRQKNEIPNASVMEEMGFRIPPSILTTKSIKRTRQNISSMKYSKRTKPSSLPAYICGKAVKKAPQGVCSACGKDDNHDTILLCDGG